MNGAPAGAPSRLVPRAAFVLALALAVAPGAAAPAADRSWVIGVTPSAPPATIHRNWMPVLDRLAQATGQAFSLKVYDKMQDFEEDLARGGPDFSFSNPMQAVLCREAQDYVPVVRSAQPLAGVLFVSADSPVRAVEDLKGSAIAFVGARNV